MIHLICTRKNNGTIIIVSRVSEGFIVSTNRQRALVFSRVANMLWDALRRMHKYSIFPSVLSQTYIVLHCESEVEYNNTSLTP